MNPVDRITEQAAMAREASRQLGRSSPAQRTAFMQALAGLLEQSETEILEANARDLEDARQKGMDEPRLDRLRLTAPIVTEMAQACRHVAGLPDPVGAMISQWQRPNGLLVGRMRVPLGVIAMIYEARPNVTVDAAILCVRAANAVILRGGSEARHSNRALGRLIARALVTAGLPESAVQLIDSGGHEAIDALCALDKYIDVIIPRGGEALVRKVCKLATMPVLKHYKGVCHAYVDAGADLGQALEIVLNAKTQRPGVCNALECLLVNRDVARDFLPLVGERLGALGVEFRACPKAVALLGEKARPLAPEDLGCEFHDLILAVVLVDDLDAAIAHIDRYGSNHTEIICTRDLDRAMRFLREVDASMVAVNASTRFNDGGQLGIGAEIGISTSKLHAYGPMGVEELTTSKFVVLGTGQVRQ